MPPTRQYEEPLSHTYGSPDIFGRRHHNNGDTAFEFYERDGELTAFDALAITELNEAYRPHQKTDLAQPNLQPGQTIPDRMIVTSPNADWMPYISLRPRAVRAREDGRFAWADFTVCPQWFINTHWHLPFVRSRPLEVKVKDHELGFCWWQLQDHHFVEAKGSAYCDLGTLRGDIADFLRGEAKKLHFACRDIKQMKDFGRLFYLANKTVDAALQLKFCSFTKRDLIYRICAFQRLYLETLAMYDWHTKWAFRLNDNTGKIYEIDETIMGAITDSPDCIAMLYRAGVPSWYVRLPSSIPQDMTIRYIVAPGWEKMPTARGRRSSECDPREFTDKDYPGLPFPTVLTACPRSGDYVVACQSWREGHFGPTDAQVVAREAPSGPATVESFPSTPSSSHAVTAPKMTNNPAHAGVNLAKFKEPEVDYVPPQPPAWKKALAAVDTNSRRIISNPVGNKLRGYQFPDPFLFITGANHRSMILAWLMMQAQWLQSLINVDTAPHLPTPQHWRNCLYDFAKQMRLLPMLPSTSKVAHGGVQKNRGKDRSVTKATNRRSSKAKEVQASLFSNAVSLGPRPDVVYWGNVTVMQGENDAGLTSDIISQVIWSVFELNFRHEIRQLDRHLLPAAWASLSEAGLRENLIRRIFPEDSNGLLISIGPPSHLGLAADNWQDRVKYVEALRRVVSGWPGDASKQLKARYMPESISEAKFRESEQAVVLVYCQTFFDNFGRAPCTPHGIAQGSLHREVLSSSSSSA